MNQDSSTLAQGFDWQTWWECMVLQLINKRKTNKKRILSVLSSLSHPGMRCQYFLAHKIDSLSTLHK